MIKSMSDQVDKCSRIFDYIAEKTNDVEAWKLCRHLGFDNPHFLVKYSLDDCKRLVDKFLFARGILR